MLNDSLKEATLTPRGKYTPEISFKEMGLNTKLQENLLQKGIEHPTQIQKESSTSIDL